MVRQAQLPRYHYRYQPQEFSVRSALVPPPATDVLAVCPGCKTIETICFVGNTMERTSRFRQVDGNVYHDCGTVIPCRLFRSQLI